MCNNIVTKDPTTREICRYTLPSEMSSVLKQQLKTRLVTANFKKLTTGNNVFIFSVIVHSNCPILQFLHKMFNLSVLLLADALLKCVVTKVLLPFTLNVSTTGQLAD